MRFCCLLFVLGVTLVCGLPGMSWAFKGDEHRDANRVLMTGSIAMKPQAWDVVNDANLFQDNPLSFSFGHNVGHFNDCAFQDTSLEYQAHYRQMIELLRVGQHRAAQKQFGVMLHSIQDFYSHSNWVESLSPGERKPIVLLTDILKPSTSDTWWGTLQTCEVYQVAGYGSVVLVDDHCKKWQLEPDPHRIHVYQATSQQQTHMAIITGVVAHDKSCPGKASIGHWDRYDPYQGLNKDALASPTHGKLAEVALHYAKEQTKREICHLYRLAQREHVLEPLQSWFHDGGEALAASCDTSSFYHTPAPVVEMALQQDSWVVPQFQRPYLVDVRLHHSFLREGSDSQTIQLGGVFGNSRYAVGLLGGLDTDYGPSMSLVLKNGLHEGFGLHYSLSLKSGVLDHRIHQGLIEYQWSPWANVANTRFLSLLMGTGVFHDRQETYWVSRLGLTFGY